MCTSHPTIMNPDGRLSESLTKMNMGDVFSVQE
jgi:hypothetical protein